MAHNYLKLLRQGARHLAAHCFFDVFVFAVIIINGVVLGMAAEELEDGALNGPLGVLGLVCGIIFLLEIVLRLLAEGPRAYFCEGSLWNWFDTFVALESLASVILLFAQLNTNSAEISNLSIVRSAKVLKTVRILRMLRVLQFAVPLQQLLECTSVAMRRLGWSLMLLLIIIYIFAVFFTSMSMQREVQEPKLGEYFGSIYGSMVTLFQSMCGGLNWEVVSTALRTEGVLYELLFLLYISISTLTVLNVITGVFTTVALKHSESDPDLIAMSHVESQRQRQWMAQTLFEFLDADKSGGVTLEDIERAWHDARMAGFLQALQLSTTSPWLLLHNDGPQRGWHH